MFHFHCEENLSFFGGSTILIYSGCFCLFRLLQLLNDCLLSNAHELENDFEDDEDEYVICSCAHDGYVIVMYGDGSIKYDDVTRTGAVH
jgi:hypothetical protein